ncbi:MAG: type II toxin-antitoxin system prevent-host-death family antitoxin [Alphaproteobacteria bacterium]|nr:type II toxin-antitoxin system prevent-host-death family antitoxin [Alphaproteobacteria bacterium]
MAEEVEAAAFKAQSLRIIDRVSRDRQPVTITKRGKPVAILSAVPGTAPSPFGAMRGSVLGYDEPFEPAVDPSDWNALR